MSAHPQLAHYPPSETGYAVVSRALLKIGVNLVDCQHEDYFLGSKWWHVACGKSSWWVHSVSGKILEGKQ